jgi:sec-independent protein translocase protein TatA
MFGLSLGHLIVIALVALLFGSRRLPQLGSALGKGIQGFKKGLSGEEDIKPSPGHDEKPGIRHPDAVLPPKDDKTKLS